MSQTDRFFEETPFFSDGHQRLALSVREFALREIDPRAAEEADVDAQFRDLLSLLAQADLLRYAVGSNPDEFDARALCLVRESLAYFSPLADLAFVMQGLGTYAISLAAPEHVKNFWLTRAIEGKSVAAFALTEPEAGSDAAALATTAERDGGSYVINGRKRFISNAGIADFYTVFVRTGTREEDGRAQISAFVVGARLPGVRVSKRLALSASHPIGEVEFSNVRVPADNRVGAEGDGYGLAMKTLGNFRASVGAAACGMARRALDESLTYTKQREQFGSTLSQFQLTQEKLADMVTELDAARLLVYRAAYRRDMTGEVMVRETSEAKLFATEAAFRIIDSAVQLHGGNGLIRDHIIERLYREIRALRIYEGTSEIQKLIIASQLLKE